VPGAAALHGRGDCRARTLRRPGCPLQTLNRFARDHGIPVRSRGTSIYVPEGSAPGIHPRDLPEPLRSALVGRRARRRLDHLLITAGHASIRQAAQALGRWPSALYDQLGRTRSTPMNGAAARRPVVVLP
jgi:hypothetical protein